LSARISSRLRREWALATGAGLAALAAVALDRPASLAGSLPVWAWCSFLLYRGLPENRPKDAGEVLSGLGAPTVVTLLRGLLVSVAAGYLRVPEVAAPAYATAVVLDGLDGPLARRRKRETLLGSRLDLEIDAVGVLVASLSGIALEKLPLGYLAIGLARYLFVLGIEIRKRLGWPVRELDPSPFRRFLAGGQMAFLAIALWPEVPGALTRAAAFPFGALTLGMFLRDWRFVSVSVPKRIDERDASG
jgi:CDP-diacylglycerol--glycerol-3-phosphate 3-phosphatidyltransferase